MIDRDVSEHRWLAQLIVIVLAWFGSNLSTSSPLYTVYIADIHFLTSTQGFKSTILIYIAIFLIDEIEILGK